MYTPYYNVCILTARQMCCCLMTLCCCVLQVELVAVISHERAAHAAVSWSTAEPAVTETPVQHSGGPAPQCGHCGQWTSWLLHRTENTQGALRNLIMSLFGNTCTNVCFGHEATSRVKRSSITAINAECLSFVTGSPHCNCRCV